MADIFVSYTSGDRDWAFWIAEELKALGHVPHVHEWEINGSADIYAWMEARHDAADQVLCVISEERGTSSRKARMNTPPAMIPPRSDDAGHGRIRLSDKTSRLRPRRAAPTTGQTYEPEVPARSAG